jgi:hypothetical protein
LKLAGQGGIAIDVSETYSLRQGKMHAAVVVKNKEGIDRAPVVFLTMRSIALDIPMRVEIPLRALLRGGPDLDGTYVVYLHVLLSDDDKEFVYYGITKRGWNLRFDEHMKAALKHKQARLPSRSNQSLGISAAAATKPGDRIHAAA